VSLLGVALLGVILIFLKISSEMRFTKYNYYFLCFAGYIYCWKKVASSAEEKADEKIGHGLGKSGQIVHKNHLSSVSQT
jgi:hypothetical protein